MARGRVLQARVRAWVRIRTSIGRYRWIKCMRLQYSRVPGIPVYARESMCEPVYVRLYDRR